MVEWQRQPPGHEYRITITCTALPTHRVEWCHRARASSRTATDMQGTSGTPVSHVELYCTIEWLTWETTARGPSGNSWQCGSINTHIHTHTHTPHTHTTHTHIHTHTTHTHTGDNTLPMHSTYVAYSKPPSHTQSNWLHLPQHTHTHTHTVHK